MDAQPSLHVDQPGSGGIMRAPEKRNPGRARTGAQDREAAAIEYPLALDMLSARQAQFLVAAHHVAPGIALVLADLAFGGQGA